MKNLKDKIVAITGAASGIGRSLALNLADEGCHLAISDINETGLKETADMACSRNKNVRVTTHKVDTSDLMRRMVAEWRKIAPLMLGDYYPLTPYSLEPTTWIAWQFDAPEKGEGFLQAFRRDNCTDDTITVKLQGLDPKATYTITNFDTNKVEKIAGRTLMAGYKITIADHPGSAIITYKKAK